MRVSIDPKSSQEAQALHEVHEAVHKKDGSRQILQLAKQRMLGMMLWVQCGAMLPEAD